MPQFTRVQIDAAIAGVAINPTAYDWHTGWPDIQG